MRFHPISKNVIAGLLIAAMVIAPSTVAAQESGGGGGSGSGSAESGGGGGSGGSAAGSAAGAAGSVFGCLISSKINPFAVPSHSGNDTKQCLFDGIFYAIKQAMIAQITESIVDWINSGFEGSPAFISDFDAFLTDTLDKAAGEFIYGSELKFLCSPFQLAIRLRLATDYRSRDYECTLSDVLNNVEGFFSGSFTTWQDWFDITTNRSNNSLGAYLSAEAELQARLQTADADINREAGWSGGFLSWKKCLEYGAEVSGISYEVDHSSTGRGAELDEALGENIFIEKVDTPSYRPCLREETQTPGKYIADAGADALGAGFKQLELADEFDEIVNALFAQLVRQALTSAGGLRGLSSSSGGQRSYLSQVSDQTNTRAVSESRRGALYDIANAAETETAYYNSVKKTLDRLDVSDELLRNLNTCYANKANNPSLSSTEQATARQRAQQAANTLSVQIAPQQKVQLGKLDASLDILKKFEELKDFAQFADTLEEMDIVGRELEFIAAGDDLHTVRDVEIAESDYLITDRALDSLDQATREQLLECEAFPQSRFF